MHVDSKLGVRFFQTHLKNNQTLARTMVEFESSHLLNSTEGVFLIILLEKNNLIYVA